MPFKSLSRPSAKRVTAIHGQKEKRGRARAPVRYPSKPILRRRYDPACKQVAFFVLCASTRPKQKRPLIAEVWAECCTEMIGAFCCDAYLYLLRAMALWRL